jgi:small conductance mechanosensitive channel
MEKIKQIAIGITEFGDNYGWATKILFAAFILFGGWIFAGVLSSMISKVLKKRGFDDTLRPFISNIVLWLMRVVVFIVAASSVGIETTSLVALIGAIGFAIGMALQGSLGNLAGGVMLLIFRPIKVGDFIIAQGESGVVDEIQLFHTVVVTMDGKTIYLPNGALSSGNITNVSKKPERRVDSTFGISYKDDIDKARAIIMKVIEADSRILKDPKPVVPVINLGDSSVDLQVRAWVKSTDYWAVMFELKEHIKKAFDKEGVSIPFPQMDVHLEK